MNTTSEPEILLTKEEIAQISKEGLNPILRHPDVINVGRTHTAIIKVTTKNGLIFIKGNNYTGFEHIHQRHDFFSPKFYWKEDTQMKSDSKIRLDNPGKFSSKSIPIFDYVAIADEVFQPNNLNIKGNKRPKDFDIYDGNYTHKDGESVNYRLVIYKDSLIVHSLFPTKKTFNREKILNYARGPVSATLNNSGLFIKIPYLNHANEVVFRVLIKKVLKENKEECFIEAFDKAGMLILTHRVGERPCNAFENMDIELWGWQIRDLCKEEKVIKHLDQKLNPNQK